MTHTSPITADQNKALSDAIREALSEQGVLIGRSNTQKVIDRMLPVLADIAGTAASGEATASLPGLSGLGSDLPSDIEEFVEFFGGIGDLGFFDAAPAQATTGASFGADPQAPAYERPADLVGGPGTTEPFAVILTDPGDWPYNNAYISTDAAALHRIQNDTSMPANEVLWEVAEYDESTDEPRYAIESVGPSAANSEAQWWSGVNAALAAAGITSERTFEGIYY